MILSALETINEIKNPEHLTAANENSKQARAYIKQVNELRMSYSRQLDEAKKQLIEVEREATADVAAHVDRIAKLINQYNAELERQREEAVRRVTHDRELQLYEVAVKQAYAEYHAKATKFFVDSGTLGKMKKGSIPSLNQDAFEKAVFGQPINTGNLINTTDFETLKGRLKSGLPFYVVVERFEALIRPYAEAAQAEYEASKQPEPEAQAPARPTPPPPPPLVIPEPAVNTAVMQAELEAAKRMAEIAKEAPGKKVKYTAVMQANLDRVELIRYALQAGYSSKAFDQVLQSMADHLANGAKPPIAGLKYEVA